MTIWRNAPLIRHALVMRRKENTQPEWATQMDVIYASDKGAMFAYCRVQRAREYIVRWQVLCCSPLEIGKWRYFEVRYEYTAADEILLSNFENDGPVHQCVNRRGKFEQFVAEHILPVLVADYFTKLAKQLFPDSDIAGKFKSGCMKTTMIVMKVLAVRLDANVVPLCQNHNFSLLTDENITTKATKRYLRYLSVFTP